MRFITNPFTSYNTWRHRYTPQMSERYIQIAVYDFWGPYILNEILALVPLWVMIGIMLSALKYITKEDVKTLLSDEDKP